MFNDLENFVVRWHPAVENLYADTDADKVAREIASLGENVEEADIVNKARDEKTELHKCFEWDDTKAAEKYRETQAKHVVRSIYLVRKPEEEEPEEEKVFMVRAFSHTDGSAGYSQTVHVIKNEDRYQLLLEQAHEELRAFKRKYECLTELKPILDLID